MKRPLARAGIDRIGTTHAVRATGRALSLALTDAQRDAIDALLTTGLFGFTRADVVRRILDERLQQAVVDGWLKHRGMR